MLQLRGLASGTDHADRRGAPGFFICAAAIVIALSALVRSVNHDESQYVAAIALMRQGLPYRDFAYLQTPLQPLLFAPLAYLPAGWVWIGARAANAALGIGTLLLLNSALKKRASPSAILVALAALTCTGAFLLATSLARNDALAMFLLAAALPPLLAANESGSLGKFALAGLMVGLAASAKINAALPAAGAALFVFIEMPQHGPGRCLALFGGALAGLVPTLVMAAIAPGEFRFDVFQYNLEAPVQWWTSISQGVELEPARRIGKLIGFAALGSVIVALAGTGVDRTRSDDRRILDFMIVAGIIGAFLPKPALIQYLVPLLPPLFARFALSLDGAPQPYRRVLILLAAVGSVAGLASSFVARFAGVDLTHAAVVGRQVGDIAGPGTVATLSPQYVAGEGVSLDERFAVGPFLYRTRGELARIAAAEGRAATIESFDEAFQRRAPSVIVVGAEKQSFPGFPQGLDQPLIAWAMAHGYRPMQLGAGMTAFVRSTG